MPDFPVIFAAGLVPVDYVVIFVYMLGMLAVGWYISRRQETSAEFFVGGRKMPWFITGVSMIATLMSTITYLGAPGEMIQHGIGQSLSFLALPFAFLVVGFLWVPFFMRLRLTSAYEYLERRFGTGARMLGISLYLWMRFLWMGVIIFTASRAVAQITEDSAPQAIGTLTGGLVEFTPTSWFYFVLLSTGIFSTLYTMLGGIKAVIWTDVAQFAVLFTGAVATLFFVAANTGTGPVTWFREVTSEAHKLPPLATWDLHTRVTILWTVIAGFMWHVCTHASDQVCLQRYFATKNAKAARRTAAVNYCLDVTMQLLLATVGAALLTYYLRHGTELPPGISDPRDVQADKIFPWFIAHGLPVGLSGLVVAALFAVAQSSIDSGINSTATVITVDLVRRFRKTQQTGHAELRLAQGLTLILGLVITAMGVALSLIPPKYNIIDIQFKSFNCVLGPLAAMFMAGMLLKHVGQRAVVIAGCIGAASGLLFAFMDLIPGWLWSVSFLQPFLTTFSETAPVVVAPTPFLIIPLSWLITFVLAAVLGGFLPGPRPEQVEGLTWRSVVRDENHDFAPGEA
ncbi:MAG TPA: hypothetical protein VMP01_02185 [Pirellulaceae bacterium]|nr:hypothetical protein [Pirellulaceae bacterium]